MTRVRCGATGQKYLIQQIKVPIIQPQGPRSCCVICVMQNKNYTAALTFSTS